MTKHARPAAWLAAGLLVLPVAVPMQAWAQANGAVPAPRSRIPTEDDARPNVPPPVSSLPPTRGISGLRLDPGAVLCRTEADLQHRAEVTQKIAEGEADAGEPLVGCRLLNQARGVDVLQRAGFGREEVKLKPSGEVGWTDAYLR